MLCSPHHIALYISVNSRRWSYMWLLPYLNFPSPWLFYPVYLSFASSRIFFEHSPLFYPLELFLTPLFRNSSFLKPYPCLIILTGFLSQRRLYIFSNYRRSSFFAFLLMRERYPLTSSRLLPVSIWPNPG